MAVECERIWIGITREQYRGIYESMGGNGAWVVYSCWTAPHDYAEHGPGDQETTWCLAGRSEPLLKNRARDGKHSYYLAVSQEIER